MRISDWSSDVCSSDLAPYSFTAFDLKARLNPPVLMGGIWAHPLGSDELGRDVLSRLIMSVRMSLLIAFFGTLIASTLGTSLGILAAHFRGRVEAVVLVLIDFRSEEHTSELQSLMRISYAVFCL